MDLRTTNHPRQQRIGRWEMPIAALSVALVIELVFFAQVFFVVPAKFFAAILPGVIVDATNSERATESFDALAVNPVLQGAAQKKADDMASKGYFAHVAPDGTEPWAWFKRVGYAYVYAGENLAVNFADSKDVVDAWMRSPSHRANIMNGHYTEIGIGVAEGEYQGRHTVFVVQFFGSPANALPRTSVVLSEEVAKAVPAATNPAAAPVSVSQPALSLVPPAGGLAPTPTPEVAAAQTEPARPKSKPKPVLPAAPATPSAPFEPIPAIDPSFVAVRGAPDTVPATPTVVEAVSQRESTVVGQLIASPRATSNAMLLVLMTALGAALLLAAATLERVHLPHALAGGTLALLVAVSFLALNHATVLAAVQIR